MLYECNKPFYVGGSASNSNGAFTPQETVIVATEGQDTFNAGFNIYTVLLNQVELTNAIDYTGRGTTTIVLTVPALAGAEVKLKNS